MYNNFKYGLHNKYIILVIITCIKNRNCTCHTHYKVSKLYNLHFLTSFPETWCKCATMFYVHHGKRLQIQIYQTHRLLMLSLYRIIQIIRSATDDCPSRPWLASQPPDATSHCHYFETLALFFSSVSEQLVMCIDIHLYSGDVSVY